MATNKPKFVPAMTGAGLAVVMGAMVAGSALLAPSSVQAVHDGNAPFELDANPTQNTLLDDWDNVFQLGMFPYPAARLMPVAGAGEVFVVDYQHDQDDETAFVQSNKDVDEVNTWSWGTKGLNPPKDDITNAYAKAYSVRGFPGGDQAGHPAGEHDHLVIYFGSDRYADDGDAAMGYWFFRNPVGLGANGKFTGTHAVGDILIQIDYRGNGANEIEVFKWVGSGGNAGNGKLLRLALGTSTSTEICTAASGSVPADSACVTTNTSPMDSPWAYEGKGEDYVGDNRFPERVFMEGAFDVTALVGTECFSSFMAETRSSHSETASLKDFALGEFDLCSIDVEKECIAGSQTVDPVNETFTTTHVVSISNDGFGGTLRDVELREQMPANTSCTIISVTEDNPGDASGLAGVGSTFSDNATWIEVADTLTGGVTVGLQCTSTSNPFQNQADVRSRSAIGAAQDVADSDTETTTEAGVCEAALNAGLVVKKWCQGDDGLATGHTMGPNPYFSVADSENPLGLSVFLKAPSYQPEVCVDIELSNPSANQKMVIDSFSDSDLGSLLPVGGLTLAPMGSAGDRYAVNRCYTPTGPDGNDGTAPFNPGDARYSDTVQAAGHGKIDGVGASAGPVTATCSLCPTCPTCTD